MSAQIDWDRVVDPEPHASEFEVSRTGRIRCPECLFFWLLWPTNWDVDVDYSERALTWDGSTECPNCGPIKIETATF